MNEFLSTRRQYAFVVHDRLTATEDCLQEHHEYVLIRARQILIYRTRRREGVVRIRASRRLLYATTAAVVLAMVGGFALANVSLGGTNTVSQGSQSTTVSAVAGLTWTSTQLIELTAAPTGTTCTNTTPCTVTTLGASDCAGGFTGSTTCATGDYVEEVSLTTVANTAFAGTVKITLYVTGSSTAAGATFYYTQAATTNAAQTIVQDFDIGTISTGPAAVTSVTVIATV